ncbi:hypothetical protein DAEQUDRAFT_441587 [Daedalea quercina L-15889]|uniref:Uncharacterized protein n=1 Tax=Daedalea quercina L-15889 TaxID=1314783 RepID=A0A165N8T9_9APHY|nr:hypothetical protein DAEQUDRAFT_441587 [Daedalea quercina L-15889]
MLTDSECVLSVCIVPCPFAGAAIARYSVGDSLAIAGIAMAICQVGVFVRHHVVDFRGPLASSPCPGSVFDKSQQNKAASRTGTRERIRPANSSAARAHMKSNETPGSHTRGAKQASATIAPAGEPSGGQRQPVENGLFRPWLSSGLPRLTTIGHFPLVT